jgi:hypothetical protein
MLVFLIRWHVDWEEWGMAPFWLSDEAWAAIEPHLPRNQLGARWLDDQDPHARVRTH